MQPNYFIINKKFAFILAGLILLCAIGLIIFTNTRELPRSCTYIYKEGKSNIKKGDRDYNPALDKDKDGIACEG